MSSRARFVAWVFAFAVLTGFASTARAGLIPNGGFEYPSLGSGMYAPLSSLSGTDWADTSPTLPAGTQGNIVIATNGSAYGAPTAPEGVQVAVLKMAGATLSQTLTGLTPGTYELSWMDAARSSGGNPYQLLVDSQVVFGGATGFLPTSTTAFASRTSSSFTVTGTSATVKFFGVGIGSDITDGSDVSTFVDNVTITAIPEPGMIVLTATGLLGLLAYAWRRRRA